MEIEKIRQVIKENIKQFIGAVGVLSGSAIILYKWNIGCLIKSVFGIPCPGCGLTRAWLSLMKGNFHDAFKWHPLFWMVPLIIIIVVFMKARLFKDKRVNSFFWVVVVSLFIAVYSMRMLTLFPSQTPMDYNKQALVHKILLLKETK